ncbi:GNAT family N-acetyltransferase [Streptomyces fuscigenes]|uniref:GNAT family N-acetyltransferase n=1 Tax=Streptomyces fuscigenes TaxID=1528880 RepID=UPI001F18F355|nr:GNAT family N-acetyltransferase [Streptomyces fuscigenes]MCF3964020.1 GNAT family N-acetyltransferase [Streptomyces fuscigenes]
MDFTIRPAEPGEYAAIDELTAGVYVGEGLVDAGNPYVERLRTAAGRAAETAVLAAVDADGTLLGSVTYADAGTAWAEVARGDEAEFRLLVVSAAARRRGVGEALVRACLARAREAGHRALVLSTSMRMTAAHRVYERMGFVREPSRDWSPRPDVALLAYAFTFEG